jgi:hypothetical protein
MVFRTFLNHFIRLPAQVLTTGRRLVVRLLAWNLWQLTFCRLGQAVETPLRCLRCPDCEAERPEFAA